MSDFLFHYWRHEVHQTEFYKGLEETSYTIIEKIFQFNLHLKEYIILYTHKHIWTQSSKTLMSIFIHTYCTCNIYLYEYIHTHILYVKVLDNCVITYDPQMGVDQHVTNMFASRGQGITLTHYSSFSIPEQFSWRWTSCCLCFLP